MGGRIDYCVDSICELTNYLHFCPQKREHYEACTCAFSVSLPTIFISVLLVIRLLFFHTLIFQFAKVLFIKLLYNMKKGVKHWNITY